MNQFDFDYHCLIEDLFHYGRVKKSRAQLSDGSKPDTRSFFGRQLQFDLREGFPLITTKKVHWESVRTELCWMLRGLTNVKYLQDRGVKIWDQWARKNGELGPVYGKQWREWSGLFLDPEDTDQVANLVRDIEAIKKDPNHPSSRRLILSAWNVGYVSQMALPPCHLLAQFEVYEGELSCHMYQRSADAFLGVPFNIAQYALLTSILAKVTGLTPGELVISYGDVHIYENHLDQIKEQLSRSSFPPPTLMIKDRPGAMPWEFEPEDLEMFYYQSHPALKGEVAV